MNALFTRAAQAARLLPGVALAGTLALATSLAQADEAAIRKTLADRMPKLPKIDEISNLLPGSHKRILAWLGVIEQIDC